ncbi:MAG: DUF3320 domain-containing protein [Paenibacillaceae bacterium]|nr:DUF3320 domain-containing protein [Paenibacillaceae bacterium]
MQHMNGGDIACEWLRYDVVNYAMQQNYVPVVRQVSIRNRTAADLRGVTVHISAEPEFAAVWTKTLDVVPAGQTVDLGAIHLPLNGTYLAGLTERLLGILVLEVKAGETTLHRESSPLAVLAYDQWGGLASMPEMAAAFVMPNHPAVAQAIAEAAPLLEQWTGNPSFDAYQSRNPNRVRMQAAALFAALQAHRPTYCVAPASFEETGQRVRLPDAILAAGGMGNCLDLTLLYAACLEAVGLHPLLVFTKGHAFPGVWLVQETFAECVQDDVSLLTKRLAAGVHEISVAEATLLCAGNAAAYQEAEASAMAKLADPAAFDGFVDVRRARASAIRPIPLRIPQPDGWAIFEESRQTAAAAKEAPDDMTIRERPAEVPAIAVTKQKQWERKLLDLSLRNTLLHLRPTRSALPLLYSRLDELEDALAEGREFQLLAKPADWSDSARSAELFASVGQDDPLALLIREEFLQKRLRTGANEKELADKATHLYRAARLSLEENGANTLYLALGLLKWYESGASELARYAPIVLIPVELLRKTSRSGFVVRIRDEEPQINITLLEMLRQDFGLQIEGLDPLPRDEKGIDLRGIFSAIRHAVMSMPRWDIVETALLGLFSFSRFVMWNDIRSRAGDLARNKVAASLMAGRLTWEPEGPFPAASQLDETYAPDQLLLPISADSSQMTAVLAAGEERSFVLHGPPGTGKSQTITNMIASALAGGKTVLFVAEKMAALAVVQSRLASIGLGPYCLELHSNKSTKKAVLEQLRLTLESARTASPEQWKRQADRLAAARAELNGYVTALHKRHRFGASLYEAIARYGRVQAAPGTVRFEPAAVAAMDEAQATAWSDLAKELRVAGFACGHPAANVWEDAACSHYTPALKAEAENLLQAYAAKLEETWEAYAGLAAWLGYADESPLPPDLERLVGVAEHVLAMPAAVLTGVLGAEQPGAAFSRVEVAAGHGRSYGALRSRLEGRFDIGAAAGFGAEAALAEWRQAERQWFLPQWLKTNRIHKQVKGLALPGAAPEKKDTAATLALLVQFQAETAALRQFGQEMASLLGALWQGGETDWEAALQAGEWTRQLAGLLLGLFADPVQAGQARERISAYLAAGRESFLARSGETLQRYVACKRELDEAERKLAEALAIDMAALDRKREAEPWFVYRERRVRQWLGGVAKLRDWCSWRSIRERALAAGLAPLVAAYESGRQPLPHDDVLPAFERAWWKAAIEAILAADPELATFSGRLFEEKIRSFRETAERFEQLTREEIAARLASRIPPLHNQAAGSSETGILLRAIRSGGRGLSLRKLFEQIPQLLARICPCMLMSPLSVAQYLDPANAPFDLVVFDEASQLPTSEAVGAMARGRSVVVVGDPKQLPPTSFFMNAATGEENDEVVPEDLESILDDCLALGMPQEHLLWHYRSRHESLIAFSNRHFYENKLLTFPSPFEKHSRVEWHPVDGFYDRGKSKSNRAEAEAVVNEIARRLRHPSLSALSIGVVTFSSVQQTLIEDLLDEAFHKDAELEQAAGKLQEPLFVKNLENVQGDERDVILFSIGYGPDAGGKVSLNFGPLNREGGWRRLNVAVSRARHEMHIFSTLRADHLDVSRTQAHGVAMLKAFLAYAEKGLPALKAQAGQLAAAEPAGAGLETQIAEALEREGCRVDVHVGASGYRVDLAVIDNERPQEYALAILCDGSGYREGRTARDRELLRAQVLRQLGWRIHRVWSMDWLDDAGRELARIREAVRAAQAEAAAVRSAAAESAAQTAEQPAAAESVPVQSAAVEQAAPAVVAAESPVQSRPSRERVYAPCALPEVPLPAEEFYNPEQARLIARQIADVIAAEGPISRPLLCRRVFQAWGMTRTGARLERQFDELLERTAGGMTTAADGTAFYWPRGVDPERYDVYRVAAREQDRRNAEDLPPQEVAAAVAEVLEGQISLPQEDLARETVKLLGYARTGASLDKAAEGGLAEAVRRGTARVEQGRVYLA